MATTNAALSAISDYWNLRAEGYSLHTRDELEGDAGRRLAALFAETLPLPEGGGRLLDVGCGPGLFSIAAAKLGWSVTGIDLSQRMLDEARANAQEVAAVLYEFFDLFFSNFKVIINTLISHEHLFGNRYNCFIV